MEWKFQELTIEDADRLRELLQKNRWRGCEFSVSNLILWAEYYHMEYTEADGALIGRQTDMEGGVRLTYPIGAENEAAERKLFDAELRYFQAQNRAPRFGLIDSGMWERIQSWYPGRFQIRWERDWADYVYSRESLAVLAGKKLHGKRNHIKRFMEQYPEWSYEPLSPENVEDCVAMAKRWCRENCCQEDDEKAEEYHLVIRALRSYRQLHMQGGLLRTRQGVVAFTLGCPITADTFDVSFEKAFAEIQGAYPMINQQFVLHALSGYAYVNREEDVGVEGLRRAKLSYQPEFLLEKGIIEEKADSP